MTGCVFCKKPKKDIIIKNDTWKALYDSYQISYDHILDIYKKNIPYIDTRDNASTLEMSREQLITFIKNNNISMIITINEETSIKLPKYMIKAVL